MIIGLVEMRDNADIADHFCTKISRNWKWATLLADGFSGDIIVLWAKALGQVSPSLFLVEPFILSSFLIIPLIGSFLVIYNSNRLDSQCALWTELSRMSTLGLPWIII